MLLHVPAYFNKKSGFSLVCALKLHNVAARKESWYIAETIPNATLKILKGENHVSYVVHKEEIARLILEYTGKQEMN